MKAMKYTIGLLLAFLPFIASAQMAPKVDKVDSVIQELEDTWTFGIDSNSSSVDIDMFNRYKSLFDANAKVSDDLNFRLVPGRDSGKYVIVDTLKDFDEYAHDAALEVTKIRVENFGPVRKTGNAVYEIPRILYIEKPARYVLQNSDALADSIRANRPEIQFEKKGKAISLNEELIRNLKYELGKNPDSVYKFKVTSTMRVEVQPNMMIDKISYLDSKVVCLNDHDNDGVLDPADSLQRRYGQFTAEGTPDEDLDGVPDSYDRCRSMYGTKSNRGCPESYFITSHQIEGAIGIQFNSMSIGLPGLDQTGYKFDGANAMDVLQSHNGSLSSTAPDNGVYAGGSYTYFFGQRSRRVGLSIGVYYNRFITDYTLDDPIRYTYKAKDPNGDLYRRQVSIQSLDEQITFDIVSIPLQFNYRFRIKGAKRWVFQAKAGPSLMMMKATSDYNTTIDVGGIYQVSEDNVIMYFDQFDPTSTRNVYFTTEAINKQNASPGAEAVFAKMNSEGYDFASNKSYRGEQKNSRTAVSINGSFEGQYKSKRESPIAVKIGLQFMYAPSTASKDEYKPIEKTTGDFNSIFNSNGDSHYFGWGGHVGLVYDF
jgi:hypothetical protein